MLVTKEPLYLYQKLTSARLERVHQTRYGPVLARPSLALSQSSWRYRVLEAQEKLPRDMVGLPKGDNRDGAYRRRLRAWVKSTVQN